MQATRTGTTTNRGGNVLILKLAGNDGRQLWANQISTTNSGDSNAMASAMAVDPVDRHLVTVGYHGIKFCKFIYKSRCHRTAHRTVCTSLLDVSLLVGALCVQIGLHTGASPAAFRGRNVQVVQAVSAGSSFAIRRQGSRCGLGCVAAAEPAPRYDT